MYNTRNLMISVYVVHSTGYQPAVLKHFNFSSTVTGHRDSYSKLTTTLFHIQIVTYKATTDTKSAETITAITDHTNHITLHGTQRYTISTYPYHKIKKLHKQKVTQSLTVNFPFFFP